MRLLPPLLAIGACAIATVSAQVRYRPTETGPWRPWSFTAAPATRQDRGATAAEVQAFQARLQELGAIVKRSPAVSSPIGFAGELWGNLDSYGPAAPGQRVVGHEDVDAARPLHQVARGDHRLQVGGDGLGALAAELGHPLVEHLLAAPAQQQMPAALVQLLGDRPADSAGRARQQDPAAFDLHGGDPSRDPAAGGHP